MVTSLGRLSSSSLSTLRQAALFPSPYASLSVRLTSSGPPPASPAKPGSFSDKYDKFVGRWPKVYAIHRMVVDGSRWCFSDIKTYFAVRKSLSSGGKMNQLSMPQLEVLVQSGGELLKMLSLIVVLQIPGPGDVLILLLIFFPRYVLTRHFWSDEQRREFFLSDISKSLANASQLPAAIGKPSTVENANPDELPESVVFDLAKLHGLYPLPGITSRLVQRAAALRQLDALLPATIDTMTARQIYFHLYIRRINYSGLTEPDCRDTLRQWLNFTLNTNTASYLAAPYFFNKRNQ